MEIKKISSKKVSDSVVEQIEKLIEHGTFKAGDKLPSVRELCELFDVGRSAARDAINNLKGRGIVQVEQGKGTYVCEFDSSKIFTNNNRLIPNPEDIRELYQVRKLLESGSASQAALLRSDEELAQIKAYINEESEADTESDYGFHLAIATASRNTILVELLQCISTLTKKAMADLQFFIQRNPQIFSVIRVQHREIFEAIESKEPQLANLKMNVHLDYVENLLMTRVLEQAVNHQ